MPARIEGPDARVPQVKGASYNVPAFLGVDPAAAPHKLHRDSVVRYAVIYLAPGDYHRIHSPSDFQIVTGRHFTGEMLPVQGWLRWRHKAKQEILANCGVVWGPFEGRSVLLGVAAGVAFKF